jgi:hypothetical protein
MSLFPGHIGADVAENRREFCSHAIAGSPGID